MEKPLPALPLTSVLLPILKRRHGTDYCAFAHTSVNRDNVSTWYLVLVLSTGSTVQ